MNDFAGLSEHELARLNALEDSLSRGAAIHWDEPKTLRGYLARPIETATVKDYNDPTQTVEKRVATLRTTDGLVAIWEGPAGLEKLFQIEGSGQPVIVVYQGEKTSQKTGRPFKAFEVIVGDVEASPHDANDALDSSPQIAFGGENDIPF